MRLCPAAPSLPWRLRRLLPWLNLPLGVLLTLLQRTPVVRLIAGGGDYVLAARAGEILRATFALSSLGAVHSLAGATAFVQSPAGTVRGTVGTRVDVAFTYTGTPSPPEVFQVTGSLPPGLNFVPAPISGNIRSGTPAITGTPSQAGTFTVFVQGFNGQGLTNNVRQPIAFDIAGGTSNVAPAISSHPESQTVNTGTNLTFSVQATGTPAPTFQWTHNGVALTGATGATLTLGAVQPADSGTYAVTATNAAGSATSNPATLTVNANPGTGSSRLANLSVRTKLAASATLIVGFATNGPKRTLIRAIGPTLTAFGVPGAHTDPRLELYDASSTIVGANEDWNASLAPAFAAVGAFALANRSLDAALQLTVSGAHSAHAKGPGSGVVLVELYDSDSVSALRLVNVSARNLVGTGDNILIAGFVIDGEGDKTLLIRAVGPTLASFGVPGTLADPKLEIYTPAGAKVTENDDWSSSLAPTAASVGAFALPAGSRDAALLVTLPPGPYSAVVFGVANGTGEALIEVYEVP